jgi:post-GPI attachment to proteins factor 3
MDGVLEDLGRGLGVKWGRGRRGLGAFEDSAQRSAPLRIRRVAIFLALARLSSLPGGSALEVDAAERFFDCSQIEGERHTLGWAESCLTACERACRNDPPSRSAFVQLLRWNRNDDCAYRCTHACLAESIKHGGRVWKYKGKWPHTRILGIQEPFSTGFSLLNLAAHCVGYVMICSCRRAVDQAAPGAGEDQSVLLLGAAGAHAHIRRLQGMSALWMGAWISSSVFHARETWWSERLDYYSGNLAMAWMVYTSIARAATPLVPMHRACLITLSGAVLSSVVGGNMVLNYPVINYGRNMAMMIGLLCAHTLAWLSSCMASPASHNRLFYISAALTYGAGLLEIWDFPPIFGSLDAHALWHGATPPLTYLFYRFLSLDATRLLQERAAKTL